MPCSVFSIVISSAVALEPSATRFASDAGVDMVSCVPVAEV